MIARKRLLSLPLRAEISPHRKYDDVTKDPHFLWSSVRKVSVKGNKFWGIRQRIRWVLSPGKIAQTSQRKLGPKTSDEDAIRSSNRRDFEYSVNGNDFPESIKKALFKSPCVLKESHRSNKSKIPENSAGSEIVIPAEDNLLSKGTFSTEKNRESIIFVEEIITLNDSDLDSSHEEPTETTNSDSRYPKKTLSQDFLISLKENSEYREYLRLKLKFKGRSKNGTGEETKIIDV